MMIDARSTRPSNAAKRFATVWVSTTLALACLAPMPLQIASAAPAGTGKVARGPASRPANASALSLVREVEGVTEYRLPNGLQVLLAPDNAKPTVTVNMTYHVGSRHENYGETGMAHLLEHLVFKGTPKNPRPYDEFNRRGFAFQGSTWYDRTNYYATFASKEESLKWYLSWQADAMVNSFIARKDLDSEMSVVRNEMEAIENDSAKILQQRLIATMHEWHNYGKDTIGARADVEGVDIGRLQAFYRAHYQPDNATLVVSGQFDVVKVRQWIEQFFAGIPKPKRTLPTEYTVDPVQDGEREVVVRRKGGIPVVMLGYHTVPGLHPDAAVMEMLANVLGSDSTGRLRDTMRAGNVEAFVGGYHSLNADPAYIYFKASFPAGMSEVDVRRRGESAAQLLESIGNNPVTQAELDRAKAWWLRSWDTQTSDPQSWGVAISESIAMGDWRAWFLLRDRVKAVTLDEVNRVARERLVRSNRTLGFAFPDAAPVRAPAPARVNVEEQLRTFKPQAAPSRDAVSASANDWASLDKATLRATLRPGFQVALLPKETRGDLVNATLRLRFGDEASWRGKVPAYMLLQPMLGDGTAALNGQALADRLSALRSQINMFGAPGELTVQINSDRQNLPTLIELLGEMLRKPALSEMSFQKSQQMAMMQARMMADVPEIAANDLLDRTDDPYPAGHPLRSLTPEERTQVLGGLTLAQIRDLHRDMLNANQARFSAAGAMDTAAVQAALTKAFGDWKTSAPVQRIQRSSAERPARTLTIATPDKQNAGVLMHQSWTLDADDAEVAALRVANAAFGGGPNARLFKRLREQDGLSYSMYSHFDFSPIERRATWSMRGAYAPQNRDRVERALTEEFKRVLDTGFDAAETQAARDGLLNARILSRAQNNDLNSMLLNQLERDRRFADELKQDAALSAVTAEQATAAWRRNIKLERMRTVWSGDFKNKPSP